MIDPCITVMSREDFGFDASFAHIVQWWCEGQLSIVQAATTADARAWAAALAARGVPYRLSLPAEPDAAFLAALRKPDADRVVHVYVEVLS